MRCLFPLLCFLTCSETFAQTASDYLEKANKSYEAGRKEEARLLYKQAAKMNSAAAHYALVYLYTVPFSERVSHLSAAAIGGHKEGMSMLIETLFTRSNSLTTTNPELLYKVYLQAKTANPTADFSFAERDINLAKMAAEAGPFDAKKFIEKYHISLQDTNKTYGVWQIAEQASRNGRFGKPNPKLVFQLVCRGGEVPAELDMAARTVYEDWKRNKVRPFDLCNYVGSGYGMGFCAQRFSAQEESNFQKKIKKLSPTLRNGAGKLLPAAYKSAVAFIDSKAFEEEGHDGTGRVAWAQESVDSQKKQFLDLVESVNQEFRPNTSTANKYDQELNTVYQQQIARLKGSPMSTGFSSITEEGVRKTQRAWIKYRDDAVALFSRINPSVPKEAWLRFLTEKRTRELAAISRFDE